jgi:Cellulase (glycosyl hydrolase family 5)
MRRSVACMLSPLMLLGFGALCAAERPAHAAAQGESLLGVTSHFLHHDQFFPDQPRFWHVEFVIPLLKELGITTVHEAVYALTAPQRALISDGRTESAILQRVQANRRAVSDWLGQYDKAGIKVVLAVMGHAPSPRSNENNEEFSTWIAELVASHPSIVAVQMHNEPNLRSFWGGTPEEYVDTYRAYAAKIRATRPDVKLLVGAVSSLWWAPGVQWLKRAVDHGVLEYADGIAMHPYNVDSPPEIDPQWRGAPASDPDHREKALHAFWAEVAKWNTTGRPLALYFTEFGYNTASQGRGHVDENKQADYLSRCILIFQDVRLHGLPLASVYWYDLKEDGQKPDNPQHHFGLINWDLSARKPAFFAYRAIARFFHDSWNFEAVDLKVAPSEAPATLKLKTWRRKSDGATIIAFWNSDPSASSTASTRLKLTIPLVDAGAVRQFFASDAEPRAVETTPGEGALQAVVELSTRASWLEISRQR